MVAAVIEPPSITWGLQPPCATHVISATQLVTFSPDSEFKLSSTTGDCTHGQPHPPEGLLASFQLESILDSESILEASMSSESGAQAVHQRFACMGCTAHSGGRCEQTFFNDYKSAAVNYLCSSQCNWSMHCIKAVTVQLKTRPQHIGDGVAGAGGASGAWRPQPGLAPGLGTYATRALSMATLITARNCPIAPTTRMYISRYFWHMPARVTCSTSGRWRQIWLTLSKTRVMMLGNLFLRLLTIRRVKLVLASWRSNARHCNQHTLGS